MYMSIWSVLNSFPTALGKIFENKKRMLVYNLYLKLLLVALRKNDSLKHKNKCTYTVCSQVISSSFR